MIVFDLKCGDGHVFEAWFGSSADYEEQRARGLVACPLCGDPEVAKAAMAPRLAPGDGADAELPAADGTDPAAARRMLAELARMQARMLAKSDWVGDRFAEEARAMHHGERDERAIHGRATARDAEALAEEGVRVAPLPFPVTPPDQCN
ncbi:DUF1178 family protein [Sphingomonas flavalba]|uniref:DUF1178 family protein n=1 Tax=Sphingomonas flavalba TaxID=2559804 RepID=UPI00109D8ECE|nr:DUF1178 family protein [Sphingomonas flavalba]